MNTQKNQHKERSFNFSGVLYPEHFCSNRKLAVKFLKDTFQTQGAISPLHDSDLQEDGTLKKEHWHFVLHFQNQKSLGVCRKLLGDKGLIQVCQSLATMCRYFFHLDDDDKFQYPTFDYDSFLNFNFQKQINAFEDFDSKIDTLIMIITVNEITNMQDLIYYVQGSDKYRYLLSFIAQKMFFLKEFMKAMDYQRVFDTTSLKERKEYALTARQLALIN